MRPGTMARRMLGWCAVPVLASVLIAGTGCAALMGSDTDSSSSTDSESSSEATDFKAVAEEFDVAALDLDYTDRDQDASYDESSATTIVLEETTATVDGSGVSVDEETGIVTIEQEGAYVVSGTLTDGQLAVNVSSDAKVQVVLAGVTIHNEDGPAIYVMQADKCFITLAEGTVNTLTDGSEYALEDDSDEPYATLFSRDDLTINGSGELVVTSSYRHAICSKDDLVITGGTYTVSAVEDALRGRDCVKILDGTFSIVAGGDGIKSNKDTDPERGFVSIDGGTFQIVAGDDGIQGTTYVQITGGELSIESDDDAIHSDLELLISGGSLSIAAGDDAVHSETVLTIDGGTLDITSCYEGIESEKIYINDGEISIVASDDGVNASAADLSSGDASTTDDASDTAIDSTEGGGDAPAMSGGEGLSTAGDETGGSSDTAAATTTTSAFTVADEEGGQSGGELSIAPNGGEGIDERALNDGEPDGAFAEGMGGTSVANEDCLIQINGGYLYVDAQGDGIDSNGSIEITGGVVLVNGPASGADGALDYDLTATISGGTVLMVGASSMAQTFTSGTQAFAFSQVSGQAGQTIAVVDEDGTVVASMTAVRSFEMVLVSSASFEDDGSYTLLIGAEIDDADDYGFTDEGEATGGTETSITVSTTASGGYGGLGTDGNPLPSGQGGEVQNGGGR